MNLTASLFLASLQRGLFSGFSHQEQLTREAHTVLPLISLSLLPLVLATWVLYREFRSAPGQLSRRVACLRSAGIVTGIAVLAGLVHFACPQWMPSVSAWRGWGLHVEEPVGPPAAEPVSREERNRQMCELWNEISVWLDGEPPPESRDDLSGIPAESWLVPGEGGPTWLYLPQGVSFVLIEPYAIDGERLATSAGESARGVLDREIEALDELRGKGL